MEINGPVHSCDVHQHCHGLEQALIEPGQSSCAHSQAHNSTSQTLIKCKAV